MSKPCLLPCLFSFMTLHDPFVFLRRIPSHHLLLSSPARISAAGLGPITFKRVVGSAVCTAAFDSAGFLWFSLASESGCLGISYVRAVELAAHAAAVAAGGDVAELLPSAGR